MARRKLEEGVMKYVVKLFFPSLERHFLRDPEIQQSMRKISQHAAEINDSIRNIEKLTGKDLSHMYLKHK
jgi:hypothetical protein